MDTSATSGRRYATLLIVFLGPVTAMTVDRFLPNPHAHWSSHVMSAASAAGMLAAVGIGSWLARRQLTRTIIAILGLLVVGLAAEASGNLAAGLSIWKEPFTDDDVWALANTRPGFEVGHDVAGWGDLLVVVPGLALAIAAGIQRRASITAACVAAVLALCPPWIWPALGPAFLLAWMVAAPAPAPKANKDLRPTM